MGEAKRRAARGEMPYRQKGGYFDRDGEVRKLAAGIDERVRQLTAGNPSFSERDLIDPMVGFLPSLHQIWTTTSDDTLANLCSEFPAFYRYAKVMEDAFDEERRRGGAGQTGPDLVPLPESVRPSVARLMSEAATLERELQNMVDSVQRLVTLGRQLAPSSLQAEVARARTVESLHKKWVSGLDRLADELDAAGVAPASAKLMAKAFGDMNERISKLNHEFFALVLAGRKGAESGGAEPTQ